MDCNPRACPNAPSLTSQRRGGSHAGSTQSVSQGARRPHVRAGSEGIFAAERSGLLGGLRDEEAGFALLVDVGHSLRRACEAAGYLGFLRWKECPVVEGKPATHRRSMAGVATITGGRLGRVSRERFPGPHAGSGTGAMGCLVPSCAVKRRQRAVRDCRTHGRRGEHSLAAPDAVVVMSRALPAAAPF